MAQGIDGVFGHSLVDDARLESDVRTTPWIVVPVGLAIGWGIFFAYTAVYLADDKPQRLHHDSELADTRGVQSAFVMVSDPPRPPAVAPQVRQVELTEPAGPQPEPTTTDAVPTALPVQQARPDASAPAVALRAPELERADFVGVWGPTAAACQAPSRRHGYIPAKITPVGAKAGRTICSFRDSRRMGNAWIMAADCSDRGRRWSSQVRLTVEGDRLTWSSAKGASSYVRCGRRDG